MTTHQFSDAEFAQFQADGCLVVRGLFDPQEMAKLLEHARHDEALQSSAYERRDADGGKSKLALWNHPGEDLYSMFSRSPRVIQRMEQLLEDEVYHYHTKMMLKEPYVGGAWEWHQDYGYWYDNGCLYPDMASCLIAVDRATRDNGCLQVLVGSHRMGRMEHGKTGEQTGADPRRVAAAIERLDLEYVECEPGDAIFFHANLLHRSDQNRSADPRWSLICCYNTAHNDPFEESRHPCYEPLVKVADAAILDWSPEATE